MEQGKLLLAGAGCAALTGRPLLCCCSRGGDAAEAAQAFQLLQASAPPGCTISVLEDLYASGDSAAAVMAIPGTNGWEQDPITTLLYTSGSSGRPKGAVYKEHILYGMLQVCTCNVMTRQCATFWWHRNPSRLCCHACAGSSTGLMRYCRWQVADSIVLLIVPVCGADVA